MAFSSSRVFVDIRDRLAFTFMEFFFCPMVFQLIMKRYFHFALFRIIWAIVRT